jgi:hypothetical protein
MEAIGALSAAAASAAVDAGPEMTPATQALCSFADALKVTETETEQGGTVGLVTNWLT